MKIKRLINCFIPVSVCNLSCCYCYVSQVDGRKKNAMPRFRLTPQEIGRALSKERLGGSCFMNICGDGETLIPPEVPEIIIELLKQGHFIEVVTNGTLTNRFDEIFRADKELLKHLEFKFSYHFMQLREKNLTDVFWNNVKNARAHGCSFTVELTPHDELIPYTQDIIDECVANVGAKCHITTAFNYNKGFELLTELSREEYIKQWGQFESPMFDVKMRALGVKRTEYCYAGDWLMSLNLADGEATQCYFGMGQNIYDDIDAPIKWRAVGRHCTYPCCFNAHALLTLGAIPELEQDTTYEMIRNRKCADGTEWLTPEVKEAFSSKLCETNREYSELQKIENGIKVFCNKGTRYAKRKLKIKSN